MLCDYLVIGTAVVHTHPQVIPLTMITMRKLTHGFPFLSHMSMGLCSAALQAARAPLQIFISDFKCYKSAVQ